MDSIVLRDGLESDSLVQTTSTNALNGAVSWGAIFAGAAAAAALSLVLVVLGSGLGFAAISPWTVDARIAETFGLSSALWLALTALAVSALGGYIAGRLRTKWTSIHGDENYFRDTVHGFLAWCVATLVAVSMFGSVASGLATAGSTAIGIAAAGSKAPTVNATGHSLDDAGNAGRSAASMTPVNYFIDSLYRRNPALLLATPRTAAADDVRQPTAAETSLIFSNALDTKDASLPSEDLQYVARGVSQSTGLSTEDAEKRVAETFGRLKAARAQAEAKAKATADAARKTAAWASLWIVVALLVGAFSASFAAMLGGRRRDSY